MAPWIGLYRWVDIFWKSNGPSHGNSMLMSVKREKIRRVLELSISTKVQL